MWIGKNRAFFIKDNFAKNYGVFGGCVKTVWFFCLMLGKKEMMRFSFFSAKIFPFFSLLVTISFRLFSSYRIRRFSTVLRTKSTLNQLSRICDAVGLSVGVLVVVLRLFGYIWLGIFGFFVAYASLKHTSSWGGGGAWRLGRFFSLLLTVSVFHFIIVTVW